MYWSDVPVLCSKAETRLKIWLCPSCSHVPLLTSSVIWYWPKKSQGQIHPSGIWANASRQFSYCCCFKGLTSGFPSPETARFGNVYIAAARILGVPLQRAVMPGDWEVVIALVMWYTHLRYHKKPSILFKRYSQRFLRMIQRLFI